MCWRLTYHGVLFLTSGALRLLALLWLIGMRERARSLGGTLSVSSVRGRGTLVTAEIPCRPRGPVYQHLEPVQPAHPATPEEAGLELEKDGLLP